MTIREYIDRRSKRALWVAGLIAIAAAVAMLAPGGLAHVGLLVYLVAWGGYALYLWRSACPMCHKPLKKTGLRIGTSRRGAVTPNTCPNCSVSFATEMPEAR